MSVLDSIDDFTKEELQSFIDNDPVYKPPPPIEMGQWCVIECSRYIFGGYEHINRYLYFKERAGSLVRIRQLS